jgi:hypothetical protein
MMLSKRFDERFARSGGVQPEAYVGIARVYEDKGQFAEAIVEFKRRWPNFQTASQ